MKRIIAIMLSSMLMFTLFAACGKGEEMKEEVKDEITSMENDVSDDAQGGKNDIEDFADDLTENGNVTDQSGEGILGEAMTDMSEMLEGDTQEKTTEAKEEATTEKTDKNR